METYEDNKNLTQIQRKRLIEIDNDLKALKTLVDSKLRNNKNPIRMRKLLSLLAYEKKTIEENKTKISISGVPIETWDNLGKKVGSRNRSIKVVELIKKFMDGK